MELSKSKKEAIKKIFNVLNLGELNEITPIESSQNIVYKVDTINKSYILKEYSKDAIKNEYDLRKRKRQISVSEKFSENGVPTILPLKFNSKYFICYKKTYYLVYDYCDYEILEPKNLDNKKIKKLANTLAIMHKLNIKSELPCQYKQIKIDFNKYLKKYKRIDNELYKILYDNYFILEGLTTNCNNNIRYIKNNMCVSHNDYKLKNILWQKDFMYLIDFDACAMVNPSVSLAECAFSLARKNNKVDKDMYKEFLKVYLKKYGALPNTYKDALIVAVNGKLQWLEYLMSKCSKNNSKAIEDTINMIKELVLYANNIDELNSIYLSVVKN